jgi:hypothetical protein
VEYAGKVFENMSMEGRMTVCWVSKWELVEEWLLQIKRLSII